MKKFTGHTYDDIGRIYHFDDGSRYYSVTTMLGATKDTKFLDEWRKKVGQKRAEGLTRIAGVIGSDMHGCLEKYLLGEQPTFPNAVVKNLFNQVKPYIDKRVVKVHATEIVLYSQLLKLGGACDVIVDYLIKNDMYYTVLDFKTSNTIKKMEWIQDYFLQLCAYGLMIKEIYGNKPRRGVLLFAYKQKRSPYNEVIVNLEKYEYPLMKRIEMFQKNFKSL